MESRSAGGRATGSRQDRSPGVHAVLDVLEALSRGEPLGLSELARELELPKSTLHRVCTALLERSWVVRDRADGRYALGLRAAATSAALAESPLVSAFRPVAERLRDRHDETVCLALLDGADSVFVAKADTTQPVRLVTAVGSRLAAFASASGRVLLADLPREALETRFAGKELVTPTGHRLGGLPELSALLARVHARGYAENVQETARGLHCLAAPVRDGRGRVVAAITLCVPTGRLDEERRDVLLTDLLVAASNVGADVAFLPAAHSLTPV